MLDKNSKIVLAMLNRLAGEYGIISDPKLISKNMPKGYNPTKLISTLNYLKDLGYLEFSYNLDEEVNFLILSHKGLNYRDIELVEIKSFIVRSILVPIGVTIITTFLLEWLF